MEYSLSALSIQLKKVFIFFVKHALDETVLSVAESVIYFHLMLSGDVESNPGPGKIWTVNSTFIVCYVSISHANNNITLSNYL